MIKTGLTLGRWFLPKPVRRRLSPLCWQLAWAVAPQFMLDRTDDTAVHELFNETNIAFIHVPKTGGISACEFLYGRGTVGHQTAERWRRFDPIKFETWMKVAVTRDPVDRFLSAFDYLQEPGRNTSDRIFAWRYLQRHPSVDSFVAHIARRPRIQKAVTSFFHFRPQTDYFSAGGEIIVDRLIPFERIAEELPTLVRPGGALPHLNRRESARTQRAVLSPASRAVIADIYADDFAAHRLALSSGYDVFGRQLADI